MEERFCTNIKIFEDLLRKKLEKKIKIDEKFEVYDAEKGEFIPYHQVQSKGDEYKNVKVESTSKYPYNLVGVVQSEYFNRKITTGTGFLVGERRIATAAHNIC